ncbi:hypothetical protein AB0H28_29950 [Micromonospora sp. NPDC050980]|uniref:hypothetical protein n=1 Tax=Micromonospora sp. NPDC050980 TaxID=3155161 RepID=UPI0033E98ED7
MGKFVLRRLRSATLAALATTAVTLSAVPIAAQASSDDYSALAGGGCVTSTQNSWNVGVCSSDNGATVFGDLYVNSRGSLGSSCYVNYKILDIKAGSFVADSGSVKLTADLGC